MEPPVMAAAPSMPPQGPPGETVVKEGPPGQEEPEATGADSVRAESRAPGAECVGVDGGWDYTCGAAAPGCHTFVGEWDDEGVFFYQAFKDEIADWALEHQRFGGPAFGTSRMTWIKPSFAWVLYRSGYGHKHHQNRILKVKLPHDAVAQLLGKCKCKEGGGGSKGRVQWDPARDIMSGDGKVPNLLHLGRTRAIQIGLAGSLSELYVDSITSIQDVTGLAHRVGAAHKSKSTQAIEELLPELPAERPYLPRLDDRVLASLHMAPAPPGSELPENAARRKGKHR